MSAREKVRQWEREENDNLIDLNDGVDEFSLNFEPISPVSTPFQATSQTATLSKSSKRKASMLDVMDRHIESINSGINNVAQAIKEGNAIAEKGIAVVERARPRCYTEEEVFVELQNIGVRGSLLLDAFLFLIKSQANMRAFFAVPSNLRLDILSKLMTEGNNY